MKNKRKWMLGGIAATLLIIAVLLGDSTGYLGAFKMQTPTQPITKNSFVAAQHDLSIDDVHITTSSSSDTDYLMVNKCNDSSSSASDIDAVKIKIEMNGEVYDNGSWTPTEAGTCEEQQAITNFPSNNFGTLIQGTTYEVTVTIDSDNEVIENDETNNEFVLDYTYTDETLLSFELQDVELTDYETLSASICRNSVRATETETDVSFTIDGITKLTTISLPEDMNDCETITIETIRFGAIPPGVDHVVTVESEVAEAAATGIINITPDNSVEDAGINGNELYAEVCGVGNAGDEIGTVKFTVTSLDGTYTTLIGPEYVGIGNMPTHGECKTATLELSNEELDLITSGGAYLEARIEYVTGEVAESTYMNNYFQYFF